MATTPHTPVRPNYFTLLAALRNDPYTAQAVLEAVAFAGSQPTWDSETIENVLYPLVVLLNGYNAPDEGDTDYWRGIAKEMGAEFPGLDEDEEPEYTPEQAARMAALMEGRA